MADRHNSIHRKTRVEEWNGVERGKSGEKRKRSGGQRNAVEWRKGGVGGVERGEEREEWSGDKRRRSGELEMDGMKR